MAPHLLPIVRLLQRLSVLPAGRWAPARTAALLAFLGTALLGQLYDLYAHHESLVEVARRLSTLAQTGLCTVKVVVIFANRRRVRALLGRVDAHFGARPSLLSSAHARLLSGCDRHTLAFTLVYMALLSVSLSLPVLSVALRPYDAVETGPGNATQLVRRLPFRISFPLDTQRPVAYALLLALHVCVAVFFTLLPPACDGLFVGLMSHAAAQLRVLQDWLRAVGDGAGDHRRVGESVRHHQAVLRFVKDLDALMQPIVFLQFAASVGSYGSGVVYIVAAPPEMAILAGIMIAALLQLGMICYYGNHVKEESLAVARAAYCGRWYHSPLPVQRSLLIVAMRGQRAATLSVGGVVEVSLTTYAEVLRLSYTFFALASEVNN